MAYRVVLGHLGRSVRAAAAGARAAHADREGTWKGLELTEQYACGVRPDDTAWCWGTNNRGQLGNGEAGETRTDPIQLRGRWRLVAPGGQAHTCGLKRDGTAWCWGTDRPLGDRHTPSPPRSRECGPP